MKKILILSDSPQLEQTVNDLRGAGHEVIVVKSSIRLPGEMMQAEPDFLFLDADMHLVSPAALVEALRRYDCMQNTRVILYCTKNPAEYQQLSKECGAATCVSKTASASQLRQVITLASISGRSRRVKGDRANQVDQAAVVVAQSIALEHQLIKGLSFVREVRTRGALGLPMTLKRGGVDLLFLDPEAFAGKVDETLQRLKKDGLLEGVAVVMLGRPTMNSDAHVPREEVNHRSLLLAARAALDSKKRWARR